MCWVVGMNMTSRHTNDPQNNCKRHYINLSSSAWTATWSVRMWSAGAAIASAHPAVHEPSSMLKLPPTVGALASPLPAVDHRACVSDG